MPSSMIFGHHICSILLYASNPFTATSACVNGSVRLLVGTGTSFYVSEGSYPENFFISNQLARGRVEICIGGQYGAVCNTGWGNTDATIVCRQLGFSSYGE